MPELVIARLLHVLGVVLWIGGVALVTTVLLPATRRLKTPQERIEFFETVERGFALQARITTLLTVASAPGAAGVRVQRLCQGEGARGLADPTAGGG